MRPIGYRSQQNVSQTYLSFDLSRIPDGYYTLRIVATDAPSHLAGNALTGFKDSDQFLLDTMPPVLSPLQATLTSQSACANPRNVRRAGQTLHDLRARIIPWTQALGSTLIRSAISATLCMSITTSPFRYRNAQKAVMFRRPCSQVLRNNMSLQCAY